MRYSSWKGVYAGYVRRELNRRERIAPRPGITLRQYDSHQRAWKPASPEPRSGDSLPFFIALVAVLVGMAVLSIPTPPPSSPAVQEVVR